MDARTRRAQLTAVGYARARCASRVRVRTGHDVPLTLNKLQWPRTGNTGTLLPGPRCSHTRVESRGKAQNPGRPAEFASFLPTEASRRELPLMVSSHDRAPPSLCLRDDFPVAGKIITPAERESPCPIVFRPLFPFLSFSLLFSPFLSFPFLPRSAVPYAGLRVCALPTSPFCAAHFPRFRAFPAPILRACAVPCIICCSIELARFA